MKDSLNEAQLNAGWNTTKELREILEKRSKLCIAVEAAIDKKYALLMTLRRAEVILFLTEKIGEAVESGNYHLAGELDELREFFKTETYQIYYASGEQGISVWKPCFFLRQFMLLYRQLESFEEGDVWDEDNKVQLNCKAEDLDRIIELLALVKDDEISYGWNRLQPSREDYIAFLRNVRHGNITGIDIAVLPQVVMKLMGTNKQNLPMILILRGPDEDEIRELYQSLTEQMEIEENVKICIKEMKEPYLEAFILYV